MSDRIGRTRTALAAMLSEKTGLTFKPERCYPAKGYPRSSNSILNDAFRWTAFPEENRAGIDSYATMTECVKYGFIIDDYEAFALDAEGKVK